VVKNHSLFLVPYLFMNFLSHYYVGTRLQLATPPLPAYVVGTSLPDLLPLAAPRTRLRLPLPSQPLTGYPEHDLALTNGIRSHLKADAAFHKSPGFGDAQVKATLLLSEAGFGGIRVRRFFVSHILVELALDAALLRNMPHLGEEFYAAFSAADFDNITLWTVVATARPLPHLTSVLERFADSRYLLHYLSDEGVAQGLSGLCIRARQDSFEGQNFIRLTSVVGQMVEHLYPRTAKLLSDAA
jgi:hypothetical protein